MTPSARVQAAIELLDSIVEAARTSGPAADTIIARFFKTRRYAGSGDRRAIRELAYAAIRRCGERPDCGRAAMLGLGADRPELLGLFGGGAHGPAPLLEQETASPPSAVPRWLADRFDPLVTGAELDALRGRAPLDLRVNSLRGGIAEAQAQFPGALPTPLSPLGLRLPEDSQIMDSPAFRSGLVEVQDEGSQLIALGCGVRPDMTIVDLCAGAGGKTLALAAEMNDRGLIVAADTDRDRLRRMEPRLERSGASIVRPRLLDPGREAEQLAELNGQADLVLVDAPCSGTGTWRRNPEARWRLTPERLERLVELQARLLDLAAGLAKPGGRMVYAVCSLLAEEGRGQAEALAERHSGLVPETLPIAAGRPAGSGLILAPGHDGTDGFFIARWRTPC
ncbi:RsmB/NOP family class I SAM-dependent RNA methyltransferase [Allosphingosinicella sp.]|jgi:16S rRNA (cytosine967-C5)-methyltransferase|uniref:RsmB/NOP family class I SAM-dependent RNA methyltransferase n=1 Tax=Allosphingosinicella sp. TaxID=2823234 RepID=UPI002EEADA30